MKNRKPLKLKRLRLISAEGMGFELLNQQTQIKPKTADKQLLRYIQNKMKTIKTQ